MNLFQRIVAAVKREVKIATGVMGLVTLYVIVILALAWRWL